MPPLRHSPRIDLIEIKDEIISKLGSEKAEKYFYQLKRLFTHRISKSAFDEICIGIIGKENRSLHNHYIQSIARNAAQAKDPPLQGGGAFKVKLANGYHRNNLQLLSGDSFPLSPRKGRSSHLRERKFRDRTCPSPLGPNGKGQSMVYDESDPPKKLVSISSRPQLEVVSVEDGEEVEQVRGNAGVHLRSSVNAPLGIQMNASGVRKTFHSPFHQDSMCNRYELLDTLSLKKKLEQKLEAEGLGISMDCVNVLNKGLDVFLKRMIRPCLDLARSRSGDEGLKQVNCHSKLGLEGLSADGYMQRSTGVPASLLDFRAAMEVNPMLLGENWPVQLERVCLRESEE